MRYFNPIQVARILNISDKTVRRHIQKGTIEATRKASGELKIAEDQIDKLRVYLELDQDTHVLPEIDMSRLKETLETLEKLVDMHTRQLSDQSEQIKRLESRLAQLEATQSQLQASEKPEKLYKYATDKMDAKPEQSAQNRNVTRNKALPDGCILYSDFAKLHGIPRETMRDYLLLGIGPGGVPGELTDPTLPLKEQIDYSERPKPGRPKEVERYFTEQQVQKAIELLRRHGKIKEASE